MKQGFLLLALCLGLFACSSSATKKEKTTDDTVQGKDCVEVLYFHGKQRCATCVAIEKQTRDLIERQFAEELKEGKLLFRTIDLSEPDNAALAEQYEVSWSSLFITEWKEGTPRTENLTEYAFANARTAPDVFQKGLAAKLSEHLKK